MFIKLYNALTHKKNVFKALKKGSVGLYTCGPTVYDYAHIGNLRTYIFEDLLKRVLKIHGYRVKHIMNITDVEDKIIRDATKMGVDIYEFVKPYEETFQDDLQSLHILPASKYPKATGHIPEMIQLISTLLKKRLAYESEGSVYFDISKFKNYGKLSGLKNRSLKADTRIDSDEYVKDNVQDFVLWKAKKEGEPSWSSPFGEGRPGWHIECSAMSMKYLGKTFDIHAGGVDLLFPHHENEIAQSQGATGIKFARYFMEGEHLLVDGEKMSKSLGNVYALRDITAQGYSPLDFRYLCLTAHYRTKLNFTWESLQAAQTAREELVTFTAELLGSLVSKRKLGFQPELYREKFLVAVQDDLNIPKALGIVWKFIKEYRKSKTQNPKAALVALFWFDQVLGLGLTDAKIKKAPQKVQKLIQKREELRKNKQWAEADMIRKEIESLGWIVEDTLGGSTAKHRSTV